MISIIRPSAIPAAVALGSTLALPTIDGLNDAAQWFVSNGVLGLSLQSSRMNGRLNPVAGVSGGNLFTLDLYDCISPVTVPNGYNAYALQVSFKLNAFPASPTNTGAVLYLEWLKGSVATPIQTYRYDNPQIVAAGGQFYILIVAKLPFKALGSPHTMQDLYLRAAVDFCDGNRALDGTIVSPPQPAGYYVGIDYLQLHLFKDSQINF